MWVRFRSDSRYSNYVGFKATFKAVDETSSSTLIIAIIAGLAVVVVLVCCVVVCIKKRKKTPNRATGERIPLSTMTTSASHPAQSGDIEHPPPPQAPYQPAANPFSPPPVGYAPVPTNPEVPPPAYPYPLEEPPPTLERKCSTVPTTRSIVSMATRQCCSRSVRTRRESINCGWTTYYRQFTWFRRLSRNYGGER
ncbi:hypothetical protein OS493_025851 [Desmophyllum pertusum]|uniref:Uncharacterized protein n=1 Tax=Desmophyllum pertusum TaxID=174260 RepID=A0A9W9YZ41_9CNID|nr:hypothetical protein OS493_025851 [Desmophyllum pertusum]